MVSAPITYTQTQIQHGRGITARMRKPRQHLELSPVRLELPVRGTSASAPIHLVFLHSPIYNPQPLLTSVTHRKKNI